MTLAAFEATLRLYLKGKADEIPTISMVFANPEELKKKAQNFARRMKAYFSKTKLRSVSIAVVETTDAVGGGTFPQSELKGYAVSLKIPELGSTGKLAEHLRLATMPVVTGASDDRLLFHMRTLTLDDEKWILKSFTEILTPTEGN